MPEASFFAGGEAVPLQNFAGPKGPLQGVPFFTGLKAGASTVVLPAQHLDADRVFPQVVKPCPFKTDAGAEALMILRCWRHDQGRALIQKQAFFRRL
jgi:hypothetical protein